MWFFQIITGLVLGIIAMFYYSQIIYPVFYFFPKAIIGFGKGKLKFTAVLRSLIAPILWLILPFAVGFLFPIIMQSSFYKYISQPEIVLISNFVVVVLILKTVLTVSGRLDLNTDFWTTMNPYRIDQNTDIILSSEKFVNDAENKLFLTKDYLGALEDYNKAIEINPNDGIDYYNRGLIKYHLGENDGACIDWKKAESLGFIEAQKLIGLYCYQKK